MGGGGTGRGGTGWWALVPAVAPPGVPAKIRLPLGNLSAGHLGRGAGENGAVRPLPLGALAGLVAGLEGARGSLEGGGSEHGLCVRSEKSGFHLPRPCRVAPSGPFQHKEPHELPVGHVA